MIVDDIERSVTRHVQDPRQHAWPKIRLKMRDHTPLREVAHTLFSFSASVRWSDCRDDREAFFYNAIFFTFALVLTDFYGIAANQIGRSARWVSSGLLLGCCSTRSAAAPYRAHLWRVGRAAGAVRVIRSRLGRAPRPRPLHGWSSFSSLLRPQARLI